MSWLTVLVGLVPALAAIIQWYVASAPQRAAKKRKKANAKLYKAIMARDVGYVSSLVRRLRSERD